MSALSIPKQFVEAGTGLYSKTCTCHHNLANWGRAAPEVVVIRLSVGYLDSTVP